MWGNFVAPLVQIGSFSTLVQIGMGLVPTLQPEPDFAKTCGFHKVLYNAKLIIYVKSEYLNDRIQNMGKKVEK